MASYVGFSLTYPYRKSPRNPTIRGRGDGRGSCISDTRLISDIAQELRSAIENLLARDRRFFAIENSPISNHGSRNELDRSQRLSLISQGWQRERSRSTIEGDAPGDA